MIGYASVVTGWTKSYKILVHFIRKIRIPSVHRVDHSFNLGQLFEYKNWAEMASGKTPLSCTLHGAIVLDVGINRDTEGRLCGDVDFDAVKDKISAITPVPGGVGPMTIAMLLHNALQLAKKRAYPPHP